MKRITKSNIQAVLTSELRLKEPRFVLEKYGTRIDGKIISPTFKGKDDLRRQLLILEALESAFGQAAVRGVGLLLAYTPDEWESYAPASTNGRAKTTSGK